MILNSEKFGEQGYKECCLEWLVSVDRGVFYGTKREGIYNCCGK